MDADATWRVRGSPWTTSISPLTRPTPRCTCHVLREAPARDARLARTAGQQVAYQIARSSRGLVTNRPRARRAILALRPDRPCHHPSVRAAL